MAAAPRILAFAGSLRAGSLNKKFVRVAAGVAERAGAEVRLIDLADFRMPVYDGDLETAEGMPAGALRLRRLLEEYPGFLISCPEYNSSIPGALKNAIDWVSRPLPAEPPLKAFRGKVISLIAASPGSLGGLRGLTTARAILSHLGAIVLPGQMALPAADKAFDEKGALVAPERMTQLERVVEELVRLLPRLA